MFRTVPLSIIRSFSLYTQQWYMPYRFADSLRAGSGRSSVIRTEFRPEHDIYEWHIPLLCVQWKVPSWSCSQAVSKPVWHTPLPCVQWKTPDDGQRNCPKHVGFYSKNKFEKLVLLVGFIIRICHDARSPERQIPNNYHLLKSNVRASVTSSLNFLFRNWLFT